MGRGRAKAKQTKIARELKYTDTGTDLARLQAELKAVQTPEQPGTAQDTDDIDGSA
ncbi:MAG: DUF3073 domain-containing protein [Catenulispora sp.]|nr:DUF3073 domain-containing protein [Catenulispora sp.]NUR60026.1 DUF3073 domain-containing protein [Catenulispora sp.]